jgi:hypothetical protein
VTTSEALHRRFTALGRPLDPSWRTNLAVLILMPVGGIAAVLWTLRSGSYTITSLLVAAIVGGGVVLGTWALGRELAPDDQVAAFVAMALGFAAYLSVDDASLILLFLAMMLCRVVNRTVGPSATIPDRIGVLGLTGLSAWRLAAPELWLVTALAFALDGRHGRDAAPSWISAGLAAAFMGLQILLFPSAGASMNPLGGNTVITALATIALLGFIAVIARTRAVRALTDATEEPLSPARVRDGMVVVSVLALRSLVLGPPAMAQTALVWATMTGVVLSSVIAVGDRKNHV